MWRRAVRSGRSIQGWLLNGVFCFLIYYFFLRVCLCGLFLCNGGGDLWGGFFALEMMYFLGSCFAF